MNTSFLTSTRYAEFSAVLTHVHMEIIEVMSNFPPIELT